MSKSFNQKAKMIYILKYLLECSDEANPVTMPSIIKHLENNGISAERKGIYSDIEILNNIGYDIIYENKRGYYIGSRVFELPELRLLADSVYASKFITETKSRNLVKKLETLTSSGNATYLKRHIVSPEPIKLHNEKIYYSVDTLNEAINTNKKVSFKYYEYAPDKTKRYRNEGNVYIVSPYTMCVSEENYYLVSYYPGHEGLTNFRVDRMDDIRITEEKADEVKSVMGNDFDIAEYTKKLFSMFHGETVRVQLECENSLVNSVIDKFGENVMIRCLDKEKILVTASVNTSPAFYAWVFMFGGKMRISSPQSACDEFEDMLNRNKKCN